MNVAPLNEDLRALYQEVILDHAKHPRNAVLVADHTCKAQGNNPMCGDRVTVTARLGGDGRLADIGFDGKGCAISIASASMMTEALKGQSVETARQLFSAVHDLCTGKADPDTVKGSLAAGVADSVDKLASLSGVRQFPVRVKCATLPWHALISCLEGKDKTTTEK
ncbi:MAG: Fe-S cluster assembly sulfur transfer protein SufU [Rhodospirillaceae bacterium]